MIPDGVVEQATETARQAADRAGVQLRTVDRLPDLAAVCELLDRIWRPEPDNPLLTTEFARALSHAGNYVSAAFDGDQVVGACVAFFAAPVGESMHSHVAGVAPVALGRQVGFALKLHQRAWALQHGLTQITWTFDPLVRRNAYFNLAKLGARAREYLVDFYGDIPDAVNAGQGSDRLLLTWDIASPEVAAAVSGRPTGSPDTADEASLAIALSETGRPVVAAEKEWQAAETVTIELPTDITGLRHRDPDAAREWRLAVRTVLGGLLDADRQVTGFSRSGGYIVERTSA